MTLARRLVCEGLGTALLVAVVVGSGITAEQLACGNVGIALLANTVATGAGLLTLILMLGTISGAHFNPVVTLSVAWQKMMPGREVLPYILVQLLGAFAGVAGAHFMFSNPTFIESEHVRTGMAQWCSEFIGTFGLIAVVISCSSSKPEALPYAIPAYIVSAVWFTATSSFVHPAVTLARAATALFCWLYPAPASSADVA